VSRVHTPTRGISDIAAKIYWKSRYTSCHHGHPAHVPELELFKDATVRENVVLGAAFRYRAPVMLDLLGLSRESELKATARAEKLLGVLDLAQHAARW